MDGSTFKPPVVLQWDGPRDWRHPGNMMIAALSDEDAIAAIMQTRDDVTEGFARRSVEEISEVSLHWLVSSLIVWDVDADDQRVYRYTLQGALMQARGHQEFHKACVQPKVAPRGRSVPC